MVGTGIGVVIPSVVVVPVIENAGGNKDLVIRRPLEPVYKQKSAILSSEIKWLEVNLLAKRLI